MNEKDVLKLLLSSPNYFKWHINNGYYGEIIRQSSGFYCGYIIIPPHECRIEAKDLKSKCEEFINVHGGITYCNPYQRTIGFDCAHAGDYIPSDIFITPCFNSDHYWTFEEVKDEVIKLYNEFRKLIGEK